MKKIVFTGGPSAGKTSIINRLKETLKSDPTVFFAPEVASMLLGNGFPRCSYTENLIFQQKAIFNTQIEMEGLLEKEKHFKLCFFDRGLMDALAYITDPTEICPDTSLAIDHYDQIFHLEVAPPFKYTRQNNQARTESYEDALKLENRLKELWSSHPNYTFISAENTFDEKFEAIFNNHLQKLLAQ